MSFNVYDNNNTPNDWRFYAALNDGRALVSCHLRNSVLIINSDGDELGTLDGDFVRPEGIAVSGDRVYVVDRYHHCVHIFDSKSLGYMKKFGSQGQENGQLNQPVGIAISQIDGKVWVADNENHRVQAFTSEGNHILTLGHGYGKKPFQFFCPCGIALFIHPLHGELIIVSEWGGGRVQVFKDGGDELFSLFGGIQHPHHVAVDGAGSVFVSEYPTRWVKKFSLIGDWQEFDASAVSLVASKKSGLDAVVFQNRLVLMNQNNKRPRTDDESTIHSQSVFMSGSYDEISAENESEGSDRFHPQ